MTMAHHEVLLLVIKTNIITITLFQGKLAEVYMCLLFYSYALNIWSPPGHCCNENYF